MGIVNVTPDSFSDGGRFFDPEKAVAHALALEQAGAEILDIGGESTRPGAQPVTVREEIHRVVPVIRALRDVVKAELSVDTMKPEVAAAALDAGASIINDVAAAQQNQSMWNLVAASSAGYVCMHMKGTPQDMQISPHFDDLIGELNAFFGGRLDRLASAGVQADQVVLDVGLGFGKTDNHNLQLLAEITAFTKWGRPLLLGASRKSFMGRVLGSAIPDRLPASLACATWGVMQGVQILRVHDVAGTVQAVRMTEAIRGNESKRC